MKIVENYIFSSDRLNFRKIVKEDFNSIYAILNDEEVMYAWEHGFTEEEVTEWIEKNIVRYQNEGYSYFALIHKLTGEFIGVMGPLIENIEGESHIGIAYILSKQNWGKGYATEGSKVCIDYVFNVLNIPRVIAQIRPENINSRKVVERVGMKIESQFTKVYRGKNMVHLIYSISKK